MKTRTFYRRIPWIIGCFFGLAALSGCGDSHEAVMKATMLEMNELRGVYMQIKMPENVADAKQSIPPIVDRLHYLRARKQNLPSLSPEQEKAFSEKYREVVRSIYSTLKMEANRISRFGGGGPLTYGKEGPMSIVENDLLPKTLTQKK